MRTAATALAMTALDLFMRPEILEAAQKDFADAHAGAVFAPASS